ncbi:MAG: hypothetical protein ACFFER_11505, partial [Candidatus Thorarchaeota archaeon]
MATLVFLVILMGPPFLFSASTTPDAYRFADSQDEANGPISPVQIDEKESFGIAEHSVEGVLDPVTVEQRGVVTSGYQSIRTDTNPNVLYDIPIDDAHNWLGSTANVSVTDLERLYIVNGTFDSGVPGVNVNPNGTVSAYPFGWSSNSTTTDTQNQTVQRSEYDVTGTKFIRVESEGHSIGTGSNLRYQHYLDTQIMWTQNITNAPYSEDFVLNLDYLYEWGPLDVVLGNTICLVAYVDGTEIWSVALPSLSQRNQWYNSGDINVHIPGASTNLFFEIGLAINATENLDPAVYGFLNAVYITALIDGLRLFTPTPPTPSSVNLQFTAGGDFAPITGMSGSGAASITNSSYWNINPLRVSISSNVSVSFNYEAKLLSHRYTDSYWASDFSKHGVYYQVSTGGSSELSFFTYLGSLEDYLNPSVIITYPSDWENATIIDSGATPVTSQCVISQGSLVIPSSVLNALGWWFFELQSPNYVNTIEMQVYEAGGDQWTQESVYRTGNISRVSISISSGPNVPEPLNLVNLTWIMPNGTVWYQESLSGGVSGALISSELVFGSLNTTAGEWEAHLHWANGTEIAVGEIAFEIHHRASLERHSTMNDPFEAEAGQLVFAQFVYRDAENGQYILDAISTIRGYWPGPTANFVANPSQKWWDASFDTSILGPSDTLITVNATHPYFDDVSNSFTIRIYFTNNELTIDEVSAKVALESSYLANFSYNDQFGTGISGANVSISYSGPGGGLTWTDPIDEGLGNYNVKFTPHISGIYAITIAAEAGFYEMADTTLVLNVGELYSEITSLNGTGAFIEFGQTYRLVLRFTNGTGHGLPGADIVNISTSEAGLNIGPTVDEGDGYYSILLDPQVSTTYTILFRANLTNHETQFIPFSITVTKIQMGLSLVSFNQTIAIDQTCVAILNVTSSLMGPLDTANVYISNPPIALSISPAVNLGGGIFRITINSSQIDSFPLVFVATEENHWDQSIQATLIIQPIQTDFRTAEGSVSDQTEFMSVYELIVFFERVDPSANVSDATIDVTFISGDALPFVATQIGDYYSIRLNALHIGPSRLSITASKADYASQTVEFLLTVVEINTAVNNINLVDSLYYGRVYTFSFHYTFSGNGTGVNGATLNVTGIDSEWIDYRELGAGEYEVNITPGNIGEFIAAIRFSRNGFRDQTTNLAFEVDTIRINVEILSQSNWAWNTPLFFNLSVTESDTGDPVSDAVVTYVLLRFDGVVDDGQLNEARPGSGIYTGTANADWDDSGGLKVRLSVNKPFFEWDSYLELEIAEVLPPDQVNLRFLYVWGPRIGLVVGAIVSLGIGQRVYSKRKREYIARALAVKRRFDD